MKLLGPVYFPIKRKAAGVLVQAGARLMEADKSYSRGETFPETTQKGKHQRKQKFLPAHC